MHRCSKAKFAGSLYKQEEYSKRANFSDSRISNVDVMPTRFLLSLLLLAASRVVPSCAEKSEVQAAVISLANRFASIRNEGLGINALEVILMWSVYS